MKDKETSEEKVFDELDTMYQRVAEIEREEAVEPYYFHFILYLLKEFRLD